MRELPPTPRIDPEALANVGKAFEQMQAAMRQWADSEGPKIRRVMESFKGLGRP